MPPPSPSPSPSPSPRVAVRTKPEIPVYLKLCSSAPEPDSDRAALIPPAQPTRRNPNNTLERLQRFGFGREIPRKKKPAPRSSDKTESLRELTEKLKAPSTPISPPAPVVNPTPPPPPPPPPPLPPPPAIIPDEEILSLGLTKPESRLVVGSYAQRTIPFRSASFSQVEYSSTDGKYIRTKTNKEEILRESTTLPRKTEPHDSVSPTISSTPSVDSAVGSDEGLTSLVNSSKIPTLEDSHTRSIRSLTHPLARSRNSRPDEQLPYTSIDGNGLKSLIRQESIIEEISETDSVSTIEHSESTKEINETDLTKNEQEWPRPPLSRGESLSEGESDIALPSSDGEGSTTPRRYSKRPLRGPYGQMLEAEMKRQPNEASRVFSKLNFLDDLPKKPQETNRNRGLTTHSLDDSQLHAAKAVQNARTASTNHLSGPERIITHQRTTSSPSQLEGISSREASLQPVQQRESVSPAKDTRSHVVVEIYDIERSYVESLQILVTKYMLPLKSPENAGLIESSIVDEIFYQVPTILEIHNTFLQQLRQRLEIWDVEQRLGDLFLETFSKPHVLDTYLQFVDNWKSAKDAIKAACQAKPAFARFLGAMAREHKGKLNLDCLLIKPVQRFPRYELLIQRLLKHTPPTHDDHVLLLEVHRFIQSLLIKINYKERETLCELESLIEGLGNLVTSERAFIRHDLITMAWSSGARKERALFLFSDLLVITSIKRRSGTIRKPSTSCPGSVTSTLEANKYKLLMRISLEDLEIVKAKDDNLKQTRRELERLNEDLSALNQMTELTSTLHTSHGSLDEALREMTSLIQSQILERQSQESQLSCLQMTINTPTGLDNISIVFSSADNHNKWEEAFIQAKMKLALSADRRPCPEFVSPVPIRKTRAGLQFTCAAATLGVPGSLHSRDVWVCNSDGYVGQVCVLSLEPEPTVISCNGVCNARILCIASIPSASAGMSSSSRGSKTLSSASHESLITLKTSGTENSDSISRNSNPQMADLNITNRSNLQIDSGSSSGSEEETEEAVGSSILSTPSRPISPAPPSLTLSNVGGNSNSTQHLSSSSATNDSSSGVLINMNGIEETSEISELNFLEASLAQSTMWLGTEDGCIHVYNCSDNIRIKKNKVKIQHGSAVHSIIYLDNKVFVSLANGDVCVYSRDINVCIGMSDIGGGGWNTSEYKSVSVGTVAYPVSKMLPVGNGKLWCASHNQVKVIDTSTLQIEHTFTVMTSDATARGVSCMAANGSGAWLSLQNSAVIKLYHVSTYEHICDVNVAPPVTKMLAKGCDDIIRQHKAACLRVTALLACNDLLWIGTSAGVILTMQVPHSPSKSTQPSPPLGVPHGHTGHVRFLTSVHTTKPQDRKSTSHQERLLIISGGDGYEDFRSASTSEVAGREDSTNHLLLWHV